MRKRKKAVGESVEQGTCIELGVKSRETAGCGAVDSPAGHIKSYADGIAKTPGPAFKPGDVVELRSGGAAMTVYGSPDRYGNLCCVWMVAGETKYGQFEPAALRKAGLPDYLPT